MSGTPPSAKESEVQTSTQKVKEERAGPPVFDQPHDLVEVNFGGAPWRVPESWRFLEAVGGKPASFTTRAAFEDTTRGGLCEQLVVERRVAARKLHSYCHRAS